MRIWILFALAGAAVVGFAHAADPAPMGALGAKRPPPAAAKQGVTKMPNPPAPYVPSPLPNSAESRTGSKDSQALGVGGKAAGEDSTGGFLGAASGNGGMGAASSKDGAESGKDGAEGKGIAGGVSKGSVSINTGAMGAPDDNEGKRTGATNLPKSAGSKPGNKDSQALGIGGKAAGKGSTGGFLGAAGGNGGMGAPSSKDGAQSGKDGAGGKGIAGGVSKGSVAIDTGGMGTAGNKDRGKLDTARQTPKTDFGSTMQRGVGKAPKPPKADIAARPILLTPIDIRTKTPGASGAPGVALTPLSPKLPQPVQGLPREGALKERPEAPPMMKQPVAVTPGPIKLPRDRPSPVLAPVKVVPVVVQPPVMVKPVQPAPVLMPAKPLTR